MSKDTTPETKTEAFTGVRAKLAAHRDAHSGRYEVLLPRADIKVALPYEPLHADWMKVQRQAQKDPARAQALFVLEVARFEGEKLTEADLRAGLIGSRDMLYLINCVFGDGAPSASSASSELSASGAEGNGKA